MWENPGKRRTRITRIRTLFTQCQALIIRKTSVLPKHKDILSSITQTAEKWYFLVWYSGAMAFRFFIFIFFYIFCVETTVKKTLGCEPFSLRLW